MGNVEDVRKVIQDLVAPDLKALTVRVESGFEAAEKIAMARYEALSAKIDALSDKMER